MTAYRLPSLATAAPLVGVAAAPPPPLPPLAAAAVATPPLWQPEVISFDIDPFDLAPSLTFRNGDSSLPKVPPTPSTDPSKNDDDDDDCEGGSRKSDAEKEKQNGVGSSNGDCCSLASSGETVPGELLKSKVSFVFCFDLFYFVVWFCFVILSRTWLKSKFGSLCNQRLARSR